MAIRSLITLLILNLALVACTAKKWDRPEMQAAFQGTSVVGGAEVPSSNPEAAYVVMIYGENAAGASYVCTGTFISEDTILTAAHCLSENKEVMSMFFGLKPFDGAAVELPIVDMAYYSKADQRPSVKKTLDFASRHDLALINFSGGLPEGAKIAQLPLQAENDVDKVQNFLALGYGRTNGLQDGDGTLGQDIGTLREVLIAQQSLFLDKNYFTVNQTNGHGVCFGDSGGPALALSGDGKSVYIVGVASGVYGDTGGANADECQVSSIYMKTSAYLPWIQELAHRRD